MKNIPLPVRWLLCLLLLVRPLRRGRNPVRHHPQNLASSTSAPRPSATPSSAPTSAARRASASTHATIDRRRAQPLQHRLLLQRPRGRDQHGRRRGPDLCGAGQPHPHRHHHRRQHQKLSLGKLQKEAHLKNRPAAGQDETLPRLPRPCRSFTRKPATRTPPSRPSPPPLTS